MSRVPIILLKTPADELEDDAHHVELNARGYQPVFVPVLKTSFTNQDQLQRLIAAGPNYRFSGVVVTSRRAADAWKAAAKALASSSADWSQTPFYVLGDATGQSLRAISVSVSPNLAPNKDLVLGSESGTSERLAHFIVERSQTHDHRLPILEFVGDKNKDVLRDILKEGSIISERLQLYETRESTTFSDDLDAAVATIPMGRSTSAPPPTTWIVFFAPSVALSALPHLQRHFHLSTQEGDPGARRGVRPSRLAAIGPTTAAFLRDQLRLVVSAVPAKPDAQRLAEVITSYDQNTPP
ncbi:tetrapyrrole biosynthesis, uroporphyrinogen III synthase [Auriculariales sp. MPI-PUGE-AT-0066]|nr:tetrapyrrole biosynthesis, uroporphyrinogen III synthase [Auriculariales sp. MPI-PUGE-AT-0066]